MFRLSCFVFLSLIACAVLAAPAPKDGWDRPIDPDNDCKFVIKDGTVTIELSGGDHDLAPKRKRFNAPRLLREVEGDFVMQVRVCALFRPSAKSSVDGVESRVAAGLVLIPVEKNYIRLEYQGRRLKGEQLNDFAIRMRGGQLGMHAELGFIPGNPPPPGVKRNPPKKKPPPANEEKVYLRFARQGNNIRKTVSLNGKKWEPTFTWETKGGLPNKFKVGLAAYSTSTEPFKVRFDKFKLVQGQQKSK
ncbi:MAG: hypothetical protein ACRELG_26085 [Gemmataceae bacterium]